jgi:hypothetical protein
MTPKKKAQIWGTITIVGFIFLLIDLLLMISMGVFTGLFIIGMLMFVIGVKFFIAYLYRVKKGKDLGGMRFWKWVLRIKE